MQIHARGRPRWLNCGLMSFFRLVLFLCLSHGLPALAALPLQPWLDTALPGASIRLPPGIYQGPAVISKPLTLEGDGKVIIDAGGQGTVLTVKADRVTLRGLTLRGSGDSHDALDGGVMAEGTQLLIENNVIEDVLFGISLHRTTDSIVRDNRIRSRAVESADRGDGLRLWYSTGNRIEGNDIAQIRDITVTNSPRNRFTGNTIKDSRRAFNFLFSHRSLVDRNHLEKNSTGIIALNSDGLIIRNNRVLHAMDASGAGIALKETSAALIDRATKSSIARTASWPTRRWTRSTASSSSTTWSPTTSPASISTAPRAAMSPSATPSAATCGR